MEDIDDDLPWDFNPSAHVFRTRQAGMYTQQATAMSTQQEDTYGPLRSPGHLCQSMYLRTFNQLSSPADEASQLAGYPEQHLATPQGPLHAPRDLPCHAPQSLHCQRATAQQQHQQLFCNGSVPSQQHMASTDTCGGYILPQPNGSLLMPMGRPAQPCTGPVGMHSTTHGIATQLTLAHASVQVPEQPGDHPATRAPEIAAATAKCVADPEAQEVRYPPPDVAMSTGQTAALAPGAPAAAPAAAAVVSEMALERYIDLHAALQRGTGSVQRFSAVEAGMFRMADLKQVAALHGLAAGSKPKQVLLERMKALRLISPTITEGLSAQAKGGCRHPSGMPVSGPDLVSLGWASPSHAAATSSALRRAQMLKRESHPQKAAAAPSVAAAQLPRPAEPASQACDVAAGIHAARAPPTVVSASQSQLQPVDQADADARVERPLREPSAEHDRPAHASGPPLGLSSSATGANPSGAAGQASQLFAAQQHPMAESGVQWRQVDRQAASEGGCLGGATHTVSAEAALPGTTNAAASGVPVPARPDVQVQLDQATAHQPWPAAGGLQATAAPRQSDPRPGGLPESAAAHVLSQHAPGSEEPLLPRSAAGMPTDATVGKGMPHLAAKLEKPGQLDMQPGPWRSKRNALSQDPCGVEEPPATVQTDVLAQEGTAGTVAVGEPGTLDIHKTSDEQSQLHSQQRDSNGCCEGSNSGLKTPVWLQDQVDELGRRSTGMTNCHASNPGALIGSSVAFVLLSAFDADEGDCVPAGLHCGRVIEAIAEEHPEDVCPPECEQEHAFHFVRLLTGKRDVHIDLKLDLHESLRQAMPESFMRLGQAALQDAWVLLEPCDDISPADAAHRLPGQVAGESKAQQPVPARARDCGRLEGSAASSEKGRGRGRRQRGVRGMGIGKQRSSRPHVTPRKFT